jgi:branched-chain amino acid transport system ATP-binding protein
MPAALEVRDIHTYYRHSYILQGISLKVDTGRIVGILGRNGMGKTTLMRSIMGFTAPRQGSILFNGRDLTRKKSYEIALLGLSLVPQGRQIFPSLNVTENLEVAARGQGWNIDTVFELFPPLKQRAKHPGDRLSGGEQQMLAIGRSLMTNPTLLLMDEPTEGLAPLFVHTVAEAILTLKKRGTSILLVEQNLSFALKHTDYIHVLSKGRVVYASAPQELAENKTIQLEHLGV